MKHFLLGKGQWKVVDDTEKIPDENDIELFEKYTLKFERALAIIVLRIAASTLYLITTCTAPHEAWKALTAYFERVSLSNKLLLQKQYFRKEMIEKMLMEKRQPSTLPAGQDDATVIPTLRPHTLRPHTLRPILCAPTLCAPTLCAPYFVPPHTLRPKTLRPILCAPHNLRPNSLRPHTLRPNTLRPHTLRPNLLRSHILRPNTLRPTFCAPTPCVLINAAICLYDISK